MQHIIKSKRDTHKNCFDHNYVRDVYHCKITFVYDDFSYNIEFCTVLGNSFNNYNNVLFNNPVEGASIMQCTRVSPLSLYPQVLNSPPSDGVLVQIGNRKTWVTQSVLEKV